MFLRESARTAAKSRTNRSTHLGKAIKRLGRFAQNLAHMCIIHLGTDIRQTNCPSRHKGGEGAHGGFLGGHKFKIWGSCQTAGTDWHQIWYTSADSSGNGHRLNTIHLSIPQGHFGGSQIQKSWEAVKRLDRLAPNLAHMCRFIWEWIYAKQIAPRDTRGHLGGFMGSNIQKSWEAVKRLDRLASTLVHVCRFVWEWT